MLSTGQGRPIPPALRPAFGAAKMGCCIESGLLPLVRTKAGHLHRQVTQARRCSGSRTRPANVPVAPAQTLGPWLLGRPTRHCPGVSGPLESLPWTRLMRSSRRLGWHWWNPTKSWSGGQGSQYPVTWAAGAPGPRPQILAIYTHAASSFSGVGSVEAEPVCLRRRAVVVPLGLGWQETGKDWHLMLLAWPGQRALNAHG